MALNLNTLETPMMRACVALLACCLAAPAMAQEVDADALAQTAGLLGDALIATGCHLRGDAWFVIAGPAVSHELDEMTKHLSPGGGVETADAPTFVYALTMRGTSEGMTQWKRYGQAACQAIQADGSLARLDALVAGFKRPN